MNILTRKYESREFLSNKFIFLSNLIYFNHILFFFNHILSSLYKRYVCLNVYCVWVWDWEKKRIFFMLHSFIFLQFSLIANVFYMSLPLLDLGVWGSHTCEIFCYISSRLRFRIIIMTEFRKVTQKYNKAIINLSRRKLFYQPVALIQRVTSVSTCSSLTSI